MVFTIKLETILQIFRYLRKKFQRSKIFDGKFTTISDNALNKKFVVAFKGQNLPQTPKDVNLLINKNLYSLTYDHKESSDENVFQYFYTIDSKYDGEIMDIEGIRQCKLCVEYDDKLKFSTKVKKIHAFKDYQEQWHKGKAKVINNAVKKSQKLEESQHKERS